MKEMLTEAYKVVKKTTGIDPSKPGSMRTIAQDDNAWEKYVRTLAESIESPTDRATFKILAENTRTNLLEASISQFGMNPYESLTLPLLRVFYPKLVGKEAVTVSPMDKPETVKSFIKATFAPANSTTQYPAPVITPDISGGPSIGTPIIATIAVPSANFDVLHVLLLTPELAHLERDFVLTAVSADGTAWTNVNIVPAVEGHFSGSVSIGAHDDVISGLVNYKDGTVSISSATALVKFIKYQVTCSLEENRINPRIDITVEKIRLYAKDRQIQANWTINAEQDMRALFDVSMQAEIVNYLSQQIALDIDREIVNNLITANLRLNPVSHQRTFTRTPPLNYPWGVKYWHENILVPLNELSAVIYKDTNINAGNVILTNPMDAAILEDLQTFNYTGTASTNGDMGYRSATVQGGKWKVLTSAVVPEGTMLMAFKGNDELQACYFYSPYVPLVLHPYPMTFTPSLTILSRYATAMVRNLGFATLAVGA